MDRPTIKDIAKVLNISPSTVSRALSGKPGASEELRKKVLETAEEMGYMKNLSAQSLKNSKSKIIGIIAFDIRNPFFLDFLKGVEDVLFPREYKILLSSVDESADKEKTYLNWMVSQGVDGILSSPITEKNGKSNLKLYNNFYKMGVPIVFYDRMFYNQEQFDYVIVDNQDAIIQALMHLKENGHENVSIFLSKKGVFTIEERLKGFLKGCELLNIQTRKEWICEDIYPHEKAFDILKMLKDKNNLPSAIIATNNNITKNIVSSSRKLNVKIPDKLSLIGFDDTPENELIDPPLTTIKQPILEIGKIAATALLSRIEDRFAKPMKVVLKAELIKRGSVKNLK
ncbi:MAG: LacI family DNA-binding transcriptional regulator [Defluviitoga tunisiensis]|jgi:LacI family transcriptional regulator|uniref:LacI family transcription regulator n=1 Tax=Defluviitoga tunisiensis TaxID=1006576 RepID=A0A0C7P283_DEFTU|nr:LacI family DNA-binding transcriptional regulator [Defluviitoga tunisiensis]MDD3601316.1 LacI family DNA-binding transcriptional regulator [Defluviitoga tunisiensis]CEP78360.1 LacI family transcription regulator [Defluviitoga tunisiensis]